jgi:hypothetical protein
VRTRSPAIPAARLQDAGDCLDVLSSRDSRTDLRSSFHRSYAPLTSGAARLFRLLGLRPTRDSN